MNRRGRTELFRRLDERHQQLNQQGRRSIHGHSPAPEPPLRRDGEGIGITWERGYQSAQDESYIEELKEQVRQQLTEGLEQELQDFSTYTRRGISEYIEDMERQNAYGSTYYSEYGAIINSPYYRGISNNQFQAVWHQDLYRDYAFTDQYRFEAYDINKVVQQLLFQTVKRAGEPLTNEDYASILMKEI